MATERPTVVRKLAKPRVTTQAGSRPPITEIGISGNPYTTGFGTNLPWSSFVDTYEYVPDLMWPNSCRQGGTYDQMRSDAQLSALFFGVTMPIRRYRWMVDPNGARPEIVQLIAKGLNLDILGDEPQPRGRTRNRFSHDKHLKTAMLALIYGHMYFEQVGWIGSAVKPPSDGMWHLRKLAERMPSTLQQIKVAPDGGLVSVTQWARSQTEIPVDRLAAFVWEGEGGNWVGRSMFRDCYKNWLIKDRLLRVDAYNHERAGGVPMPEAPLDATDDEIAELSRMAQEFRVGEFSGGALPPGAKWQMAQAQRGSAPVIDSVRYHDEAMARRFLMMVAMLAQGGTTLGSYSLGEVFSDFFSLGQEAIANWYRDTMNEHVIEDWVDWNWGEDEEQVPLLTYNKDSDQNLAMVDLVQLVDKKLITVDADLEDTLRYRYNLPKRAPNNPGADPTPPVPTAPISGGPPGAPKPSAPADGAPDSKASLGAPVVQHWPRVDARLTQPEDEPGSGGATPLAPSMSALPDPD